MPMIQVPVPETIESVQRPVMLEVVRQLMQLTEISSKTNLVYFGDIERGKQLNSALGQLQGDDPNKFPHNDKITIEVSEVYEPDRVLNDIILRPENLLIFKDEPLNIIMKPGYAYMGATITVKYRANNKNLAQQWHQYMKSRISQRRNLNVHVATYNFGVPDSLLYILEQLHALREEVAGYGDTFDQYWAANRHPKMTMLTNLSGSAKMWAIPETQARIQGWFDFELPDEASKDKDGDTWTTQFSYKFGYARPEVIVMTYPVVVHNQVIPDILRDDPLVDYHDMVQSYAMTTRILEDFEGTHLTPQEIQDYGYQIPDFDEFMPTITPIKTRRLLTVLFLIDQADPDNWLNLTQLEEYQFTPEIIEYMKSEHENLGKHGNAAIHISLYRDSMPVDNPLPFEVDENLNVIGITPIQLRHQHHLRISLLTDWYMLRDPALTRMQDHGVAAIQMLRAIDPTLEERGYMPKLIGDNFVGKLSLKVAMQNARPALKPTAITQFQNNVQTLFIDTSKPRT